MISQHWFRQWLGAFRQQAIAWANVDQVLFFHVTPLGHYMTFHFIGDLTKDTPYLTLVWEDVWWPLWVVWRKVFWDDILTARIFWIWGHNIVMIFLNSHTIFWPRSPTTPKFMKRVLFVFYNYRIRLKWSTSTYFDTTTYLYYLCRYDIWNPLLSVILLCDNLTSGSKCHSKEVKNFSEGSQNIVTMFCRARS